MIDEAHAGREREPNEKHRQDTVSYLCEDITMTMRRVALSLAVLVTGVLAAGCSAGSARNVAVNSLFTDNMVLQRDMPVKVWGTADPDGTVVVSVASRTARAQVAPDGTWCAVLPPMPAGGPHQLRIAGAQTRTLTNVMIGDVWLCSGQSNMEMVVASCLDSQAETADAANYPNIRFFNVAKRVAPTPQTQVLGEWQVCSPSTAGGFSAAGYFMGRELHKTLNVPIGLINSSWGGTPAQPWTPREGYAYSPDLMPILEAFDQSLKDAPDQIAEWTEVNRKWEEAMKELGATGRWPDPGNKGQPLGYAEVAFDDADWQTMQIPATWESTENMQIDGAVWFRTQVTIPPAWNGKDLILVLGAIDDFDQTYFNGVEVGSTGSETPGHWAHIRRYTVPGQLVKSGTAVIAVRAFDNFGGGGMVGGGGGPAIALAQAADETIPLAGGWKFKVELELPQISGPPIAGGPVSQNAPTCLYNAMIAPLTPFAIKGAAWYQGESNSSQGYQYRTLLKGMITGWREVWGQGDFPFLTVLLANFAGPVAEPGESDWAELREAQVMSLSLPNTGIASATDIGEAADIHPKNKQDVGKRLALAALHVAYGKTLVYSGPRYAGQSIEGDRIRLTFDHVGGGLVAGRSAQDEKLAGFAIAGADRKFIWADAQIDGTTVVVSHATVKEPVAVRYAWATNPANANLYNKEGLPAVPFRTDDWPGITQPK